MSKRADLTLSGHEQTCRFDVRFGLIILEKTTTQIEIKNKCNSNVDQKHFAFRWHSRTLFASDQLGYSGNKARNFYFFESPWFQLWRNAFKYQLLLFLDGADNFCCYLLQLQQPQAVYLVYISPQIASHSLLQLSSPLGDWYWR